MIRFSSSKSDLNNFKMSVSDFLKNLPTHNSENFTKLNSSDGVAANGRPLTSGSQQSMTSRHRPAVYIPTTDYPTEQVSLWVIRKWLHLYFVIPWSPFLLHIFIVAYTTELSSQTYWLLTKSNQKWLDWVSNYTLNGSIGTPKVFPSSRSSPMLISNRLFWNSTCASGFLT